MARAAAPTDPLLEGTFIYDQYDVVKLVDLGGNGLWENHPFFLINSRELEGTFDYRGVHIDKTASAFLDGRPAIVPESDGYIRAEDIDSFVCTLRHSQDRTCSAKIEVFESRLTIRLLRARVAQLEAELDNNMDFSRRVVLSRVRGSLTRAAARQARVFTHHHLVTTAQARRLSASFTGLGWNVGNWQDRRHRGALRSCLPTNLQLLRFHPHVVLKKLRGSFSYLRATNFRITWNRGSLRLSVSYRCSLVVMRSEASLRRALRQAGLHPRDIARILANRPRVLGRV